MKKIILLLIFSINFLIAQTGETYSNIMNNNSKSALRNIKNDLLIYTAGNYYRIYYFNTKGICYMYIQEFLLGSGYYKEITTMLNDLKYQYNGFKDFKCALGNKEVKTESFSNDDFVVLIQWSDAFGEKVDIQTITFYDLKLGKE